MAGEVLYYSGERVDPEAVSTGLIGKVTDLIVNGLANHDSTGSIKILFRYASPSGTVAEYIDLERKGEDLLVGGG